MFSRNVDYEFPLISAIDMMKLLNFVVHELGLKLLSKIINTIQHSDKQLFQILYM